MWILGYIILGLLALASSAAAVFTRRLLPAVVSLGLGSVMLAVLFFMMDAPYAGGFELSVGAGLISVLFLVIISLTEEYSSDKPQE